jgi:hypothetical protein
MKLLDGLAHGDKRGAERARRLKAGRVLVREYQGERQTVTVVPDGLLFVPQLGRHRKNQCSPHGSP